MEFHSVYIHARDVGLRIQPTGGPVREAGQLGTPKYVESDHHDRIEAMLSRRRGFNRMPTRSSLLLATHTSAHFGFHWPSKSIVLSTEMGLAQARNLGVPFRLVLSTAGFSFNSSNYAVRKLGRQLTSVISGLDIKFKADFKYARETAGVTLLRQP